MFSTKAFKENQPIGWTGALRHVSLWVTSPSQDIVYQNPNYQLAIREAQDDYVEVDNESKETEIAIYCIHGTADRPAAFSLVAERLLNNLPATISKIHLVAFENRGQGKDIESFGEQLANKIKSRNDKNVILMGHSRGGLVAAYFAEYLALQNDINVHAVIAVCSPFGGSDKALPPLTWISKSVDEMQKNSEFLNALTDRMRESKVDYRYFSVSGDLLVSMDSCYIEEHSDKLTVLEREHGHLSVLSSHELVECIQNYLTELDQEVDLESLQQELVDPPSHNFF